MKYTGGCCCYFSCHNISYAGSPCIYSLTSNTYIRRITESQLIYVLLGAVGLPVFAGWTGGLGNVLGMTGGFIIGYIPCAWLTGLIYKKFGYTAKKSAKILFMIIGMVVGNIALYALGTVWFMVVTGMTLEASLAACVIPFIPGNFIKMAAVIIVALPVETAIRKTMYASNPAI